MLTAQNRSRPTALFQVPASHRLLPRSTVHAGLLFRAQCGLCQGLHTARWTMALLWGVATGDRQ